MAVQSPTEGYADRADRTDDSGSDPGRDDPSNPYTLVVGAGGPSTAADLPHISMGGESEDCLRADRARCSFGQSYRGTPVSLGQRGVSGPRAILQEQST